AGTSSFAADFQRHGIRDRRGRSLRQFDLNTRMFKYPCSFLIHSSSYAGMPSQMRDHVENRLAMVLTGRDQSRDFDFLGPQDRRAIGEILSDTLPGFKQRMKDARSAGSEL
ncbi:MAG: hypothetical protein MI861_24325, partial [Pirellulales bacterium]|nr:hypothetical protein [Pirellulales bacterium]